MSVTRIEDFTNQLVAHLREVDSVREQRAKMRAFVGVATKMNNMEKAMEITNAITGLDETEQQMLAALVEFSGKPDYDSARDLHGAIAARLQNVEKYYGTKMMTAANFELAASTGELTDVEKRAEATKAVELATHRFDVAVELADNMTPVRSGTIELLK